MVFFRLLRVIACWLLHLSPGEVALAKIVQKSHEQQLFGSGLIILGSSLSGLPTESIAVWIDSSVARPPRLILFFVLLRLCGHQLWNWLIFLPAASK